MKKRILVLIALMAVLLLVAGPVNATPPTTAEGSIQCMPFIVETRLANGNIFLTTAEMANWSGTFQGTSAEYGKVVIHSSGSWSFSGTVGFAGTVDGKWGLLQMRLVGSKPDVSSDWEGTWVILSGTDDLANLRGQGTWWGPGAPDVMRWGDIYYSGNIHFESD